VRIVAEQFGVAVDAPDIRDDDGPFWDEKTFVGVVLNGFFGI
jgi:hypothetical protein